MTYQVLKSRIPGDFEETVALHVIEKNNWIERERIVSDEEKTLQPLGSCPQWGQFSGRKDASQELHNAVERWKVEKNKRHARFPKPIGHPDVEKSIVLQDGHTFVADYEIVDDTPTPDQILRAKKDTLIVAVRGVEQQELEKLLPPVGKRRAIGYRKQDIATSDNDRVRELAIKINTTDDDDEKKSLLKLMSNAQAYHISERPVDDTVFLAEQKQLDTAHNAVLRWAALVESDIEDLTESDIDAWAMPTPPSHTAGQ